jgi:hypothetical protein
MRTFATFLAGAAFVLASLSAQAAVSVHVDQSAQRMIVRVDGATVGVWPVSTARAGKRTPNGTYRPYHLARFHRSSLYDNAPMPYSVFFRGNYAIHGTTAVRQLGRPASAGCIRLHPSNARVLYELVQRNGMRNVRITITGAAARPDTVARRTRQQRRVASGQPPRRAAAEQRQRAAAQHRQHRRVTLQQQRHAAVQQQSRREAGTLQRDVRRSVPERPPGAAYLRQPTYGAPAASTVWLRGVSPHALR